MLVPSCPLACITQAEPDEADGVSAKLAELDGEPKTDEVTEEALERVEVAAEEAEPK